ncbi:DUF4403 family protein [Archangium lansingense]|uniref:DUF4403 family protein n=1 Tax=Archangium lansingense TaxID=2995310 RepID=A0ABT4AGL7_9BACT|nr:DUF4403 family protein [Archangium lansinium]MCY1080820.1 DUF4403 family protein [Archangium lansinium]
MPSSRLRPLPALLASLTLLSCAGPRIESQTLQPPPPAATGGRPVSDPPPSRIVIHTTIFREALLKKMAESLPRTGEGDAQLFAGQKLHYTWQREPLTLKFDRGRVVVGVPVLGRFNMLGDREMPITVTIAGEPVMTADFKALLQSTEVQVVAAGPVDAVNRALEAKLKELIGKTLDEFRFDVRPLLSSAFARLARPIEIPVGGGQVACAELKVTSLEAAPTMLADGFEKDLGIVVMPSVTLPCTPVASLTGPTSNDGGMPSSDAGVQAASPATSPNGGSTQFASYTAGPTGADGGSPGPDAGTQTALYTTGPTSNDGGTGVDAGMPPSTQVATQVTMPLLQNVSTLPSGPFKVVIPVAARYEELSKALEASMNGRLHFSESHPELYMENPQVYPSDDTVVIKMNLGGKAKVGDYSVPMSGELFFAGHPHVIDNQITVPDLEITPGTASELLKLKFALDYKSVRDQARQALRVDISERLAAVKDKMSTEMSFSEDLGCVRGQVLRSEVTGIYPHPSFLRIYVQVDAQLGLYLPCKK